MTMLDVSHTGSRTRTVGRALVLLLALSLGPRTAAAQTLACEAEAVAAIDLTQAALAGIDLPLLENFVLNFALNRAEARVSGPNGNATIAIGWLDFFITRVGVNESAGNLSAQDADTLTELASEALLILQGCSSTPRVAFLNVRSDGTGNTLFWVNPSTSYASTRLLYRTDTFPVGPNDPLAVSVGDFPGTAGASDSTTHGPLTQGATYFYSAFTDDGGGNFSAAKHSFGEPKDDSGPFNWSYTAGGPLPVVGVDAGDRYYALSSDALHAMDPFPTGGGWPAGWQPVSLSSPPLGPPSVGRPVPLPNQDRVFFGTRSGTLVARDLDGNQVWESPVLGDAIDASIAADATTGIVFVGARVDNGDSSFYGLDINTGQIAWSFDNGGGATGMGPIVRGAAWRAGKVYFNSTQKPGGTGTTETLFCLSYTATTATKDWSATIGDASSSVTFTIDGSFQAATLYSGNTAGELHAFDLTAGNEGTRKWVYDTLDGPVRGLPFAVFDSQPIFFSTDNEVQAIDPTGNVIWKYGMPGLDPSPVVVLLSGGPRRVYVGGGDNVVYSIRASDGMDVQTFVVGPLPGKLGAPSIDVAMSGQLLIGSDKGVVYALDLFGFVP